MSEDLVKFELKFEPREMTMTTSPAEGFLQAVRYAMAPKPAKVIFNAPATVVIWEDGMKTIVKCSDGDAFDAEKGLLLCIAKRFYGNSGRFNNVLRKWAR